MNTSSLHLNSEIEDRLRFEMLLTELSARFVSVTAETVDNEIVNAQRQIGEALGLERSTLFQVEGDGKYDVTHSWQVAGLPPFPGFAAQDLPWLSNLVLGGEEVCWERIEDLPEEAAREKEIARRFGPRSSFTSPLRVGGKVIGAISFGTVYTGAGMARRHIESPAALRGNDWQCTRAHSRRKGNPAGTR